MGLRLFAHAVYLSVSAAHLQRLIDKPSPQVAPAPMFSPATVRSEVISTDTPGISSKAAVAPTILQSPCEISARRFAQVTSLPPLWTTTTGPSSIRHAVDGRLLFQCRLAGGRTTERLEVLLRRPLSPYPTLACDVHRNRWAIFPLIIDASTKGRSASWYFRPTSTSPIPLVCLRTALLSAVRTPARACVSRVSRSSRPYSK